jgi:hypothetical protein
MVLPLVETMGFGKRKHHAAFWEGSTTGRPRTEASHDPGEHKDLSMETCTTISLPLSEGHVRVPINKQMKNILGSDDEFLIKYLKLYWSLREKLPSSIRREIQLS